MAHKPSVIRGVVHDANGRPVEMARIYFKYGPVPLPDVAMLTGSDGSFALTAPAPGTYQLEVSSDSPEPTQAKVTVEEGREAHLKIKIKR